MILSIYLQLGIYSSLSTASIYKAMNWMYIVRMFHFNFQSCKQITKYGTIFGKNIKSINQDPNLMCVIQFVRVNMVSDLHKILSKTYCVLRTACVFFLWGIFGCHFQSTLLFSVLLRIYRWIAYTKEACS